MRVQRTSLRLPLTRNAFAWASTARRRFKVLIPAIIRFAAIAGVLGGSVVRAKADSLVVVGTGSPGPWRTVLDIANPTDSTMYLNIREAAGYFLCMPVCPIAYIGIPPSGSTSFTTFGWGLDPTTALHTIYVTSSDGTTPVVHARTLRAGTAGPAAVLPVIRLSTLDQAAWSALSFPYVSLSNINRLNLAVGVTTPEGASGPFSVLVQVYSSDGILRGGRTYSNSLIPNELGITLWSDVFVVDVLEELGISGFTGGQIRIVKASGDGAIWGALAVVSGDGNVEIVAGENP